jgi:nucleoside-diphosphate-sugar epimerase
MARYLITGGAGYFGEVLARQLVREGHRVRSLDLNRSAFPDLEQVVGDVRNSETVEAACQDIDIVVHAVAQVPLAKDHGLFWSVNRDGTRTLLEAAKKGKVGKVVYISSSAVFGVPKSNPVTADTIPSPAEDYGHAKLAGEQLCREAASAGLDVSIVRPRTILGHGRMGVVQILLDWVANDRDVPVLDGGRNRYQFVHADDLAQACIAASVRPGLSVYNIGAERFGTMRELLQGLIRHAGSRSKIKSLPMAPAEVLLGFANKLKMSPLGPYHTLMYGREIYFDISLAKRELGYAPKYSDQEAICQSYDWYKANLHSLADQAGASPHRLPVRKGILMFAPILLKVIPQ